MIVTLYVMSSDKQREGNKIYEVSVIAIIFIDFVIALGFTIYGIAMLRMKSNVSSEDKNRELIRVCTFKVLLASLTYRRPLLSL